MSTNSTIAIKNDDGTFTSIYCHWDGYVSHNGSILLEHYRDVAKINELMQLGDLSSLGAEIGEKHPFTNPYAYGSPSYREFDEQYKNTCTAYGRDREENDMVSENWTDAKEWLSEVGEEYNYLFDGDNWFVSEGETDEAGFPIFTLLETELLMIA